MHQQGTSSAGSFVAMVASFVLCLLYKDVLSGKKKKKVVIKVHFISSIMAQRGRSRQ